MLSSEYWKRFWTAPKVARCEETASIAASISSMSCVLVAES